MVDLDLGLDLPPMTPSLPVRFGLGFGSAPTFTCAGEEDGAGGSGSGSGLGVGWRLCSFSFPPITPSLPPRGFFDCGTSSSSPFSSLSFGFGFVFGLMGGGDGDDGCCCEDDCLSFCCSSSEPGSVSWSWGDGGVSDDCFAGSGSGSGVALLSRSCDEVVEAVVDAGCGFGSSGSGDGGGLLGLGLRLGVGVGLGCFALVFAPPRPPIFSRPLGVFSLDFCGGGTDFLVGDCFGLLCPESEAWGSFSGCLCCFSLGGVS